MTRFADQLFDDLMQEHGAALAHARKPPAPRRHLTARPVLLAVGAGGLAVAATVGSLVATGGGTPAYAVTRNSDGTVTLAVYQQSGIAGANSKLRAYGDDRVVVVPVESGCRSIGSLPAPAVPARRVIVQASGSGGTITVDALGVPAGDILVLGVRSSGNGQFEFMEHTSSSGTAGGYSSWSAIAVGVGPFFWPNAVLTSGKAPSCVSVPGKTVNNASGRQASGASGRASSNSTRNSSSRPSKSSSVSGSSSLSGS
jgi:hypothetical protein